MYYLETNVIRSLSNELNKIVSDSFTSGFAILEIVSGIINSNEYNLRKKILKNLLTSNLKINWKIPENLFISSFNFLNDNLKNYNELKLLVNEIIKSKDYINLISNNGIKKTLDYFINYDKDINDLHFNSFNYTKNIFNKSFKKSNIIKKILILLKYIKINTNIFKSGANKVIFNFASFYSKLFYGDLKKANVIYKSYNKKMNKLIIAFCYYTKKKILIDGSCKSNDFHDLLHFLYLENTENIIIVSNDKLIKGICEALYPKNYCSIDDFKDICNFTQLGCQLHN